MATLYLGNQRIAPMTVETKEASKYGMTIDNMLGDVDENGVLQWPADTTGDIVFNGVKVINKGYIWYYKHYSNNSLTHGVSFPDLEEITGIYSLAYCFSKTHISSVSFLKLESVKAQGGLQRVFDSSGVTSATFPKLVRIEGINALNGALYGCSYLASVSFPKLNYISGNYACASMLQGASILPELSFPELTTIDSLQGMQYLASGCRKLKTVSFPKLTSLIQNSIFLYAFDSCYSLTDIYFNALTTNSFGSTNTFNNMFSSSSMSESGSCTIHFPSNMEETISGLTGYPNFGATAGRLVLAYDLPATE